MTGEWSTKHFEQMAQLVKDTVNPSEAIGVPYVALEHIGQGSLSLLGTGVAEDAISLKNRFRQGDILFGKLRPYFRKMIRSSFEGVCSTDIWVVRPRPGVDAGFLFYLMASDLFLEPVVRSSQGTKMPRAQWEYASLLELPMPPINIQRAIAHILGTLDDKIELNRRMNETLEQMAQALFKAWFVDFEPVRAKLEGRWQRGQSLPGLPAHLYDLFPDAMDGDVPQGWRKDNIFEIADLMGGGTPSTSNPDYWNGNIYWVSAKDVSNVTGAFILQTEKTISELGVKNSSTRILPIKATIVTARGTVGACCLLGKEMAMNQTNYGFVSKDRTYPYFVFFSLLSIVRQLRQHSYGTIFDTITTKTFQNILCILPSATIIYKFEELITPFMDLVLRNQHELLTLSRLRDTLLPNLISGKLRVKEAERFLKEAGV